MKTSLAIAVLLAVLTAAAPSPAEDVDLGTLEKLTQKLQFAVEYGDADKGDLRFVYADRQAHIHVYRYDDGSLDLDWEQTNLGSLVTSLFVTDLYGDGDLKLVLSTAAGRILIYEGYTYDLEWENLQDPFERIRYMISENLDDDPQDELVFIANDFLYIYDSLNRTIEWQSQSKFEAKQIIAGDVDDDDQLEIILNTGTIIDSRFYNIEFQADTAFGDRISLFDINGDGIPEIFGEFSDFNIRVFDVYAERELW